MTPFMLQDLQGNSHVNFIRIFESILSGAFIAAVVLYGVVAVLEEKVGTMQTMVESHISADTLRQIKLDDRYVKQQEILTRHETVLKQSGLFK